jgi:hypothetical protein
MPLEHHDYILIIFEKSMNFVYIKFYLFIYMINLYSYIIFIIRNSYVIKINMIKMAIFYAFTEV